MKIGFWSALLLMFIGLKLANVIGWSWWWVLAPAWVPFVLIGLMVLIIAAGDE